MTSIFHPQVIKILNKTVQLFWNVYPPLFSLHLIIMPSLFVILSFTQCNFIISYLPKCGFYGLGYYLIMFTLHQFYLQTKLVKNIRCQTSSILRTFHNLSYKRVEVLDHSPTKSSSSSGSGPPKREARFQEINSQ
jgi:hypothetical protein